MNKKILISFIIILIACLIPIMLDYYKYILYNNMIHGFWEKDDIMLYFDNNNKLIIIDEDGKNAYDYKLSYNINFDKNVCKYNLILSHNDIENKYTLNPLLLNLSPNNGMLVLEQNDSVLYTIYKNNVLSTKIYQHILNDE